MKHSSRLLLASALLFAALATCAAAFSGHRERRPVPAASSLELPLTHVPTLSYPVSGPYAPLLGIRGS